MAKTPAGRVVLAPHKKDEACPTCRHVRTKCRWQGRAGTVTIRRYCRPCDVVYGAPIAPKDVADPLDALPLFVESSAPQPAPKVAPARSRGLFDDEPI